MYPPPEDGPTPESVHMLRRKVTESQRLRRYLLAEASRNEAVIEQLKGLITGGRAREVPRLSKPSERDLSFLTSSASAKALNISATGFSQQPITTNTRFALSQLPALRSLLADLRPRLAELQTSATRVESVREERMEERREYIEQRARLHLQRHGEGNLLNNLPIAGKRVEPEEIEALEKVADMLDTH